MIWLLLCLGGGFLVALVMAPAELSCRSQECEEAPVDALPSRRKAYLISEALRKTVETHNLVGRGYSLKVIFSPAGWEWAAVSDLLDMDSRRVLGHFYEVDDAQEAHFKIVVRNYTIVNR